VSFVCARPIRLQSDLLYIRLFSTYVLMFPLLLAFISVEVLDYAGLLKDLDDFELYEENKATIKAVKQSFVKSVKEFKTGIRNQLNPKTLDARIKANKEASTGFAAGAFVGFMI